MPVKHALSFKGTDERTELIDSILGLKANAVKSIRLFRKSIGDEEADLIAKALKENTSLKSIRYLLLVKLASSKKTPLYSYFTDLTTGVRFKKKSGHGSLLDNNIGDRGAGCLAEALMQNSSVNFISLLGNNIGNSGAASLADALKRNRSVQKMILSSNSIGDAGVASLADSLIFNESLKSISLGTNNIGDAGAASLADALENNSSIEEIGLEHNRIGDAGAAALLKKLKLNTSVKTVNTFGNSISEEQKELINDAIDHKPTDSERMAATKEKEARDKEAEVDAIATALLTDGLSAGELTKYETLYLTKAASKGDSLSGEQIAGILRASGLEDKALKEVWDKAKAKTKGKMTFVEFLTACRLVVEAGGMFPEVAAEKLWLENPTENGLMAAETASIILKKSGLAKAVLKEVWEQSKGPEPRRTPRGKMSKSEFLRSCLLVVRAKVRAKVDGTLAIPKVAEEEKRTSSAGAAPPAVPLTAPRPQSLASALPSDTPPSPPGITPKSETLLASEIGGGGGAAKKEEPEKEPIYVIVAAATPFHATNPFAPPPLQKNRKSLKSKPPADAEGGRIPRQLSLISADEDAESLCDTCSPCPKIEDMTNFKSRPKRFQKFVAPEIMMGVDTEAVLGLPEIMGINDKIKSEIYFNKEKAIIRDFKAYGTAEDKINLDHVLKGSLKTKDGKVDWTCTGGKSATLDALLATDQAKRAKLERHHVLALRLYSTSSYKSINDPLRQKPPPEMHPFAATTLFIRDGIKKLSRTNTGDRKEKVYWRGMSGTLPESFSTDGGVEFGVMSTSSCFRVAVEFAKVETSSSPLIFKYVASSTYQRGANISFLSVYPEENEILYPPLTNLEPALITTKKIRGKPVTFVEVKPHVE